MTSNGAPVDAPVDESEEPPAVVRRLEGPSAALLGGHVEIFEELKMVLRCCERLVAELAEAEPDAIVVESVWTTALLSYGRCFPEPSSDSASAAALTVEDLNAGMPGGDGPEWHEVLMRLRDHYADPVSSPRERFTVAVTQDVEGNPSGVAITSARQPLVDDLTVRQTGAIAYALSNTVNQRIEAQQHEVSVELEATPRSDLEKLERVEIAAPAAGS